VFCVFKIFYRWEIIVPQIFISYRRADSQANTDRIYERLTKAFGRKAIFKDVDDIPPGVDFPTYLQNKVKDAYIVLIIIGRQWASISYDDGSLRLNEPEDFVRVEVELALRMSNVLVIPILVNDATMPNPKHLPDSIRPLTKLNAMVIRNDPDFHNDISRLIRRLKERGIKQQANFLPLIGIAIGTVAFVILALSITISFLNARNEVTPTVEFVQQITGESTATSTANETPVSTDELINSYKSILLRPITLDTINDFEMLETIDPRGRPTQVEFTPNGNYLAITVYGRLGSGSFGSDILLINTITGEIDHILPHDDWVNAFAISADSRYLISASGNEFDANVNNSILHKWEIYTGEEILTWQPGASFVSSIAFDPHDSTLIGLTTHTRTLHDSVIQPSNRGVEIWQNDNILRRITEFEIPALDSTITINDSFIVYWKSDKILLCGLDDPLMIALNPITGQSEGFLELNEVCFRDFEISPDSSELIVVGYNTAFDVINLVDNQVTQIPMDSEQGSADFAFGTDIFGIELCDYETESCTIEIRNSNTQTVLHIIEPLDSNNRLYQFKFSPQRTLFVVIEENQEGTDGFIQVWGIKRT
jgi:WD40 repeat protein